MSRMWFIRVFVLVLLSDADSELAGSCGRFQRAAPGQDGPGRDELQHSLWRRQRRREQLGQTQGPGLRRASGATSPTWWACRRPCAPQIDDMRAALPEYGEIGVGREDGKTKGEYSAILYRKDRFTVDDSGTFWLSDTPEIARLDHLGQRLHARLHVGALAPEVVGQTFLHVQHAPGPHRRSSRGKRASP